jgi:hypothetical protein
VLRNGIRLAVAVVGAALLLIGALVMADGAPAGLQALILGAVLLGGVVFERAAYKPLETSAPTDRFQRTPERFIDPETHAPVTVFIDPATGERKYVKD